MHFIDDIELIRLIKSADEHAFRCLFERYHKLMFLEARSVLDNDDEAKDCVQDIFIWIWEKKFIININYSVRSYLIRAVKYNCANRIRAKVTEGKRRKLYSEGMYGFFQQLTKVENKELSQRLVSAINEVPPVSRLAFKKSFIEGKSLKEIAAEMGVSIFTAKNNISRAIRSLRKALRNAY